MKTCPDCGERVYKLGCVNCDEAAYIEQQCADLDLCAQCGSDVHDCRCNDASATPERGAEA